MKIPTDQEIIDMRDALRRARLIKTGKRKGDHRGIRPTWVELEKKGYTVCLSRVQRTLNKADEIKDKPKAEAKKGPAITKEDLMMKDPNLVSTMAALLDHENSSTVLAVRENRVRMALNIVIAERMAANPGVLLLDMKGAAALVEALTMAAKLSGGAAVDVMRKAPGEMRDITPVAKTALQNDIEQWREKRKSNGTSAAQG